MEALRSRDQTPNNWATSHMILIQFSSKLSNNEDTTLFGWHIMIFSSREIVLYFEVLKHGVCFMTPYMKKVSLFTFAQYHRALFVWISLPCVLLLFVYTIDV